MAIPDTGYEYGRSMLGLCFSCFYCPRATYIGESLILFFSINITTITNMLSKVLRNTTPSLRALRQVTPVAKAFSSSPIAKAQGEITREPIETPLSLWNFTEEEDMIRQTGQLFHILRGLELMSSEAIC